MTKNTVLTQYNSPNYTPNASVRAVYGYPRSIDYITIHWWGDPKNGPTIEGVISWFSQTRSQVSAHDIITGTGRRVAVMVNYYDAAWHSGNARGNATTLGFELDPRCRQIDYETAAQDIADTWKYYKRRIPLKPHNYWQATQCPGNYNLTKLYNMANDIYNGKSEPKPPKVTLKKRTTYNPAKDFKVTKATTLVNIPSNTKYSGSQTYKVGTVINDVVEKLEYSDGKVFYRTKYAKDIAKKYYGFGRSKLTEIVPPAPKPEPTEPEWIENLEDVTDVKLSVLPAQGTAVINLGTLMPLPNTLIPKGTKVDVAKETTVKGKKYYITNYSASKGLANGVLASDLGTPVVEPPKEKPEWLKNLKDIEDVDMWTRSGTPVLKIADGTIVDTLPVNTQVHVIKSTQVIGIDLLVLEGETTAIETVYLSDTPIPQPDDDLEARVGILEKIVNSIVNFLSGLFKNFKA